MRESIESILLCQSPALFLAAVLLIVRYFILRKKHRFHAVMDLILGILCIAGGVALYFVGISRDLFTIKDFWQVRTTGYIGMAVVAVLFLILLFRAAAGAIARRRAQRAADRREDAYRRELEEARKKAYADGMADAKAAELQVSAPENEVLPAEDAPVNDGPALQ